MNKLYASGIGAIALLLLGWGIRNAGFNAGIEHERIERAEENKKAYDELKERTDEINAQLDARASLINQREASAINLMSNLRNDTYSRPNANDECFSPQRVQLIQSNIIPIRNRSTPPKSNN